MSTRKHSPRARGFRPESTPLEGRQLLSGFVSGMDSKGDSWTFQMTGPGQVLVVKQPDSSGNPAPLNSLTDIATITIDRPETRNSLDMTHFRDLARAQGLLEMLRLWWQHAVRENGQDLGS